MMLSGSQQVLIVILFRTLLMPLSTLPYLLLRYYSAGTSLQGSDMMMTRSANHIPEVERLVVPSRMTDMKWLNHRQPKAHLHIAHVARKNQQHES